MRFGNPTIIQSRQLKTVSFSQNYLQVEKFYIKCKIMESSPSEDIRPNSFSFENDLTYNEMEADLEFRKNALRILEKYTLMLCAVSSGELDGDIDKTLVELVASIHLFALLSPSPEYLPENYSGLFKESVQIIKKIDSAQRRADVLKKNNEFISYGCQVFGIINSQ